MHGFGVRPAAERQDDRAVLAALTFMNGHGVGRFQLGEHIEGVFRQVEIAATPF